MSPDREHLHHKLMSLGLESRTALLVIYAGQLGLSCLVLSGLFIPYRFYFSLTIVAWCLTMLAFIWLHYATDPKQRWVEYQKMRAAMEEREAIMIKAKEDEARFKEGDA